MDFLGARIQFNPRPLQATQVALDVGVLGHCLGRVRVDRLKALNGTLDDMRAAGFSRRVDFVLNDTDTSLYDLPIPLHSSAEFDDIFPDAHTQRADYVSVLGGEKAWLPQVVDDFFANGGERLWLVRVPEDRGVSGFLPVFGSVPPELEHPEDRKGLACLFVIPSLGLIALPDLERLQIPARLPDIPRKRLINPDPQFLPIGTVIDDGHRERRYSSELPEPIDPPLALLNVLRKILSFTAAQRPDIQYLLTLPLDYSNSVAAPVASKAALDALTGARNSAEAYLLRQVQLLFPYLRTANDDLRSPAGVIAGAISASAKARGIWRSIASTPLVTQAKPYPPLNIQQTIALRELPGIGVINQRLGQIVLDDERLVVPALHRNDYTPGTYSERLNATRSAEVVRFLGFLKRQLQALGEQLIFNTDPQDPRPQIVLERFFGDLYRVGALRGRVQEEAFSISRSALGEGLIAFDIEIAPAYPIDKIVVTFINRDGEWSTGVSNA